MEAETMLSMKSGKVRTLDKFTFLAKVKEQRKYWPKM